MSQYHVKPISIDELVRILNEMLDIGLPPVDIYVFADHINNSPVLSSVDTQKLDDFIVKLREKLGALAEEIEMEGSC